MRHATCAAVLFLRVTEGLSVLGGETEKERKGRKNIYISIATITGGAGSGTRSTK